MLILSNSTLIPIFRGIMDTMVLLRLSNKLDKHVSNSSLSEQAGETNTNRWHMVSIIKNSLYPREKQKVKWKAGTAFLSSTCKRVEATWFKDTHTQILLFLLNTQESM